MTLADDLRRIADDFYDLRGLVDADKDTLRRAAAALEAHAAANELLRAEVERLTRNVAAYKINYASADQYCDEARATLATTRERLEAAVEVLRAAHDWRGVGEDPVETFERIAQMFRNDTGYMAPGKDVPAAMNPPDGYDDERRAAWAAWCERKNNELDASLAAAIRKEPT